MSQQLAPTPAAACMLSSARAQQLSSRRTALQRRYPTYSLVSYSSRTHVSELGTSNVGIIGLPGVSTPAAYLQHWQSAIKPQLDARWASFLRTSNPETLLFGLDGLLMDLRSTRSLAVHLQQHHEDAAWVKAAAQVATNCQKYEAYIHSNKALADRLSRVHARLIQSAAAANNSTSEHKQQSQPPCQQNDHQHMLLQLCNVLMAVVNDNMPRDSLEWLAALELPDSNAQQLQQLKQQEREIIADIDATSNSPVVLQLPAPVDALLQLPRTNAVASSSTTACSTAPEQQVAPSATGLHSSQSADDSKMSPRLGTRAMLNSVATKVEQQAPEPEQHLVYVPRSLMVQLLQQCSNADVRQQVYVEALLPKLQKASVLLDQLARCRHSQAQLSGYRSYLAQTEQRINRSSNTGRSELHAGTSAASPELGGSVVDFLLQLAKALKPLAELEVDWVIKQSQSVLHRQQLHGEEQKQVAPEQQHADSSEEQQPQQQQQPDRFREWDWDWLLQQAHAPLLQQLRDPMLQQHMQLDAVLVGFGNVVRQLLNVQLIQRPVGGHEVWGSHVRALMVVQQQQHITSLPVTYETGQQHAQHGSSSSSTSAQTDVTVVADDGTGLVSGAFVELLGTVYLDVGGAYGTRMLRYTKDNSDSSDTNSRTVPLGHGLVCSSRGPLLQWQDLTEELQVQLLHRSHSAPAVAVGLCGSRITVQQLPTTLQHRQPEQDNDGGQQLQQAKGTDSNCNGGSVEALVLSVAQFWELGHEMGHALHLILSSRQHACHLSGRFLPPSVLEVPSQLFEHLFTSPSTLSQLCLHHATHQQLPQHLAVALASYYGARYSSPLALSVRVAASLAEQMYGQFGDDAPGCDIWRGSWEMVSCLPGPVAAAGCLRELSLLPVMAAHSGTYHCYITSWLIAARIAQHTLQPLLGSAGPHDSHGSCGADNGHKQLQSPSSGERTALQQRAMDVFNTHAGMSHKAIAVLLRRACGQAATDADALETLEELVMHDGQMRSFLENLLWRVPF